MPKREESEFRNLWAVGSDNLPEQFREYLELSPRGSFDDNEQMLWSFFEHNKAFAEFWKRTPVADVLESLGVPCEECFANLSLLPTGFWIVKIQSDRCNQIEAPIKLFSWRDGESIRDALFRRTPFTWRRRYDRRNAVDLYLFGNSLWSLSKTDFGYSSDQLPPVFIEAFERERKKDERRNTLFRPDSAKIEAPSRKRIPDHVRKAVWERDKGQCVNCGSASNLQFDHIIPVSKGGGQNAENVELLCDLCNRAKGSELS